MSREILFRGKRLDNGKWIEGDGIHYPKSINYLGSCWINGMGECANDWVQVDPVTVGRFTGVYDGTKWEELSQQEKDRWLKKHSVEEWNGRRIFEGDMFDLGDKDIQKAVIEFRDYAFRLCLYGIYGQMTEHGWDEDAGDCELLESEIVTYYDLDTLEVIGNIHDKPELVGEESE